MALNKILLAGVALPLLSITLSPAALNAQPLRPALVAPVAGPVVLVQDSGEVLDENGQPVEKKRKKKHKDQAAEEQPVDQQAGDNQAVDQQADEGQQNRKERKKKREQAQDQGEEQPQDQAQEQVTDEQPAVNDQAAEQPVEKKKKKKQQQAESEAQTDQATDPAADPAVQQTQDATAQDAGEKATDEVLPKKKKHKKDQQQVDGQPEDQPKDQAADQAQPDNGAIADEAADQGQAEKKKKRKTDQVQSVVDEPLPAEVKQEIQVKEKIAENPAKTTEVIELPVKNGNAVLDSEKDVLNAGDPALLEKRRKQREKVQIKVPQSDLDAQVNVKVKYPDLVIEPVINLRGEKLSVRPDFEEPAGRRVVKGDDVRIIFNIDNRIVIRNDLDDRLWRGDARVRYEQLDGGRIREVVVRPDGTRVVTIRNRYGEIIRRSRLMDDDREIIIFYSPDLDRGRERLYLRDPGWDLPPMRLGIPLDDYIIDTSSDPDRDYRRFLAKPPVERVERVYTLDEVKYSARIRDKVRRIDLDTITFDTGSAEISMDQASSLRQVASAIRKLLAADPGETFLIEGHTDAVGSDESNLVLSDQRAESVANVLSDLFDIPPENLATQGYGERFLKVDTEGAERLNRRVTIRRVTPLVRPVAEAE